MPPPKLTTWPRDAEHQPFDTGSWNRWINFANGQLSAPQVWAQDSGVPGLTWAPQTPRLTLGAPLVASGTVAITGPLTVSTTAQFSGAVTMTAAGSLTAAGPVSITGPSFAVAVGTTSTIAGPLTASGAVSFTGPTVSVGGSTVTAIGGPLTASNTVGISGPLTVTAAGSLTAAGPVSITGPSFAVTPLGTFAGGVTLSAGNLTFTGTSQRIRGDFSAATQSTRPLFQTSVANSITEVSAIPNGTGAGAAWSVYSLQDPTVSPRLMLYAAAGTHYLLADALGGATPLPLAILVNGAVRQKFETNGDIVLGSGTGIKIGAFGGSGAVQPIAAAAATDLPTALTLVNTLRTGLRSLNWFG